MNASFFRINASARVLGPKLTGIINGKVQRDGIVWFKR